VSSKIVDFGTNKSQLVCRFPLMRWKHGPVYHRFVDTAT